MKEVIINFPVQINKFDKHTELKEQILDAINRQTGAEHIIGPNTDIWKCDWKDYCRDWTREWLGILADPLRKHLANWSECLGYEGYDIQEIWFQQYTHGGSHDWHTHSSNFTNVYYLDLPSSIQTEWIDPITKQVHAFDVEEGDIITFPSFLIHRAPINSSNKMKTIISWNMNTTINDFYGE
jgi:hypothetical protein